MNLQHKRTPSIHTIHLDRWSEDADGRSVPKHKRRRTTQEDDNTHAEGNTSRTASKATRKITYFSKTEQQKLHEMEPTIQQKLVNLKPMPR